MKTVMKFLTLGLMMVAFGAISASSTFAQATVEECSPIYENFKTLRTSTERAKLQEAVTVGKNYLAKCKDLPDNETIYTYVTNQIPKLEAKIDGIRKQEEFFDPFNKSVPAKDWATAFRTGKLVINENPDDVDVPLVLASIGFDLSVANPPVDTYNADAISMAKLALQKMEQGKTSGTGNFGAFVYTYKTKDCADGKTNAIGWMNYTIGNIMFTRMNQKKEALPYFYKATQVGCDTKDRIANVYRTIGSWYIDEFKRLEAEKNASYEALTKLKTDDPGFADAEKKYKDLVALQKGYMERVMDSYARAYNAAVKAKETAAFSNGLLNLAKEFYTFRNGKPDGFDAWLAGVSAKPFADPTVAVTPIVEAETTSAPTAMTAATEAPATNTSADTRPRTAPTTAKTATAPATATKTAATTTTKKAPAKKPAPKKKGTR